MIATVHPIAQKEVKLELCYFNFYQHEIRRRRRSISSFNASLYLRARYLPSTHKNEFTPFNYFNQILYHFNVATLIML